jgi:hypothetical protein
MYKAVSGVMSLLEMPGELPADPFLLQELLKHLNHLGEAVSSFRVLVLKELGADQDEDDGDSAEASS